MIDLLAFDDGCGAIRGHVDLVGERMADLLARSGAIRLIDVELHDLRSRAVQAEDAHTIDPNRLSIVVGTGPRGSLGRRVETASRPVSLTIGPFTVHGFLHAPFPADPIAQVFDRTWIPLTDAVLEYQGRGRMCRERFDTLLVNRVAARTLAAINESAYEVRWLAGGPPELLHEDAIRV
jgi:hypothetical protein